MHDPKKKNDSETGGLMVRTRTWTNRTGSGLVQPKVIQFGSRFSLSLKNDWRIVLNWTLVTLSDMSQREVSQSGSAMTHF